MTVPFANIADGMHHAVLAMGAAPGSGVNPYVQFIPIVLVFAIFYFIILLPPAKAAEESPGVS